MVVIEMPAADRASPLAETLVRACSDSVAEGRCVLASERDEPNVTAVAIVTWEDAARRAVTLTIGLRRLARAEWLSRRVEFRDADAQKERWRAVGLVIATLVGQADRGAPADPAATNGASSDATSGAPTRTTPSEGKAQNVADAEKPMAGVTPTSNATTIAREVVWLDGGAMIDPGLGDAWFRWGGWLRVSARPSSLPFFVNVGGRYVGAPPQDRGLSLRWASAFIGVGTFIGMGALPVRLEIHADMIVQLVHAGATDPSTGASDSSARWVAGGRAGADVVWAPAPAWALLVGGETTILSSGTVLRIENERRGRDAAVGIGAIVGARAFFR